MTGIPKGRKKVCVVALKLAISFPLDVRQIWRATRRIEGDRDVQPACQSAYLLYCCAASALVIAIVEELARQGCIGREKKRYQQ
eukprot:gene20899-27749_t